MKPICPGFHPKLHFLLGRCLLSFLRLDKRLLWDLGLWKILRNFGFPFFRLQSLFLFDWFCWLHGSFCAPLGFRFWRFHDHFGTLLWFHRDKDNSPCLSLWRSLFPRFRWLPFRILLPDLSDHSAWRWFGRFFHDRVRTLFFLLLSAQLRGIDPSIPKACSTRRNLGWTGSAQSMRSCTELEPSRSATCKTES